MSTLSSHGRILRAFRQLMKAQRTAFAHDTFMQQNAKKQIRHHFHHPLPTQSTGPAALEEQLKHAEEATDFLLTSVIQAQKKESGKFDLGDQPSHRRTHSINHTLTPDAPILTHGILQPFLDLNTRLKFHRTCHRMLAYSQHELAWQYLSHIPVTFQWGQDGQPPPSYNQPFSPAVLSSSLVRHRFGGVTRLDPILPLKKARASSLNVHPQELFALGQLLPHIHYLHIERSRLNPAQVRELFDQQPLDQAAQFQRLAPHGPCLPFRRLIFGHQFASGTGLTLRS